MTIEPVSVLLLQAKSIDSNWLVIAISSHLLLENPMSAASLNAIIFGACSALVAQVVTVESAVIASASAFMEDYGQDMASGRREAVIKRYDSRGCFRMGQGQKRYWKPEDVRAYYLERYKVPLSFRWRDLTYEVLSPDSVVALGLFEVGLADGRKVNVSYTGLLLRQNGEWKIRLEDESRALPVPPEQPAPSSTTK